MKHSFRLLLASIVLAWAPFGCSAEKSLDPVEVKSVLLKSADWHLENPVEWVSIGDWHMAPLYNGLLSLSQTTGEAKYLASVIERGERVAWKPRGRTYHADDQAVGHAWLDIYSMDTTRTDRIEGIKAKMDFIIENPTPERARRSRMKNSAMMHWYWCDALYMAPPTLARMSEITGDQKYLRFMDHEYWTAIDKLYDGEENLFYRDERYLDQRTPSGKKIFWSRGNGWVYGGLAAMMEVLPENDLTYGHYKELFIEMTESLVALQNDEGLWWPSLLDENHVASRETSGTAFYVYGLAWGINKGILDKDKYWPVVVKGWNGLVSCIQPSGKLGYVQPVGASPEDNISADSTQEYGIGALLLAGSEILKALGHTTDLSTAEIYQEAQSLYENGAFVRTASAHYVPRRVDDIAWENDKVAFRVYGPALRESSEDNGIDIWQKRVDYPVIRKWYEKDISGVGSYHKDTGEGYDAYKVGATRGCGGTGIWYEGKLYTPNTYKFFDLNNTRPDRAGIVLFYEYEIDGMKVMERKNILLREGSYLCDARSVFFAPRKLLPKLKFAIGLVEQSDVAEVLSEDGVLTVWDKLDGYWVATAVKLSDSQEGIKTEKIANSPGDTLLVADLDDWGRMFYSFGFSWEMYSDFSSHKDWREYVSSHENTIMEIQLNGMTDEARARWDGLYKKK